jgi:hypothetical protein
MGVLVNFSRTLALIAALPVGGCAGGMLPGSIYSQSGKVLDFQIERAQRSGAVTALDRSTGEHYTGQYVGILETVRGSSTSFAQAGTVTGVGFQSMEMGSNVGNATAYLTGDKGSSLNCQMKIEAGLNPHGLGACSDQKGGQYRLQF